jgi:hypothetical protein
MAAAKESGYHTNFSSERCNNLSGNDKGVERVQLI